MKQQLKAIDTHLGGSIRNLYTFIRFFFGSVRTFNSRRRVRKTVGPVTLNLVKKLNVIAFPNRLSPANVMQRGYVLEKIFNLCKIQPRQFSPTENIDLCLNWQDMTYDIVDAEKYFNAHHSFQKKIGAKDNFLKLNFLCIDIGKRRIGEINSHVFGYDLDVDPTKYIGRAVCKSDDNATHDGVVLNCPVEKSKIELDKVYSVLINNSFGREVLDFRVPYINGFVDFFYEKRRPIEDRFSNKNTSVKIRYLADEFTKEELLKIGHFMRCLGADYGELDVLRCRDSNKIFIVDFAKTPFGPPNGLSYKDADKAVELMSIAFIKNVAKLAFN